MTVVVGLIGVLVGASLAAAYSYWSTRRTELEQAVVAVSVLADELRALLDPVVADRGSTQVDTGALIDTWRDHRDSLVVYVDPAEFRTIGSAILSARGWTGANDETRRKLDEVFDAVSSRGEQLRADHQAFILTPLFRYLRGRPWSRGRRA